MRLTAALAAFSLCLLGGCCFPARPSAHANFADIAARNLTQDPIRCLDERAFTCFACAHAEAAWKGEVARDGNKYSVHHAKGFKEGFIDYLDAGGNGEPPLLPPFRYRLTCKQNEGGANAIEDWYAGFRHGARVAMYSGLRETILVPLPQPTVVHSTPPAPVPVLPPPTQVPVPPMPPAEKLPAPQGGL